MGLLAVNFWDFPSFGLFLDHGPDPTLRAFNRETATKLMTFTSCRYADCAVDDPHCFLGWHEFKADVVNMVKEQLED